MATIKATLKENPGASKVRFVVFEENGGHHVIRAGTHWNVSLSAKLIEQLNIIVGPNSTRVLMERGTIEREAQPAWKTPR
jgi:hypothetical protein